MYKGGNLTESIACGHGRFVFDLPFAPEKLEALISFKTTLLNFLFALATFLTYQSPLLSLPTTVQPTPTTVTVAVVNDGIKTARLPL